MAQIYKYTQEFTLESGAVLPSLEIAYDTYGEMNAERSNIIWVCHALTANSDVADWWPHTVEEGCFLDSSILFSGMKNRAKVYSFPSRSMTTQQAVKSPRNRKSKNRRYSDS